MKIELCNGREEILQHQGDKQAQTVRQATTWITLLADMVYGYVFVERAAYATVIKQLLVILSCNACYFSTTGRRSANGKPFPVQFGAAKRLRSKPYGKWNLAYCCHSTKKRYSLLLQVSYTGGCKTLFNKILYSLRSFYQIARKQLLISTRYPAIAPHLLKGAFLLVATCLYLVSSILHVYCIKCL